jgi:ATP adenylyltransferase
MSATRGLERLWSPWRMAYVAGASGSTGRRRPARRVAAKAKPRRRTAPKGEDCLFCRVAASRNDRENLVLARRPNGLLMLNRFPYNPAHVMVAVREHVARFADLNPEERADLLDLTSLAERALEAEYQPHGINAGANLGRVAGAGFPGHLHLHLVPRWDGDTNFMPVIGVTRVLPEGLAQTWARLRRALAGLDSPARSSKHRG